MNGKTLGLRNLPEMPENKTITENDSSVHAGNVNNGTFGTAKNITNVQDD